MLAIWSLSHVTDTMLLSFRLCLSGCTLSGCTLTGCTLTGCTLTGCTLSGCTLTGCTLTGCTLTGCTLHSSMHSILAGLSLLLGASGAQGVKRAGIVNIVYVFVNPPSIEALEDRLRGRGTETEDKIRTRCGTSPSSACRIILSHQHNTLFALATERRTIGQPQTAVSASKLHLLLPHCLTATVLLPLRRCLCVMFCCLPIACTPHTIFAGWRMRERK